MKNKLVVVIVAVLILLVGGYGSYRLYKHFKQVASPISQMIQNAAAPKTLKDLLGLGSAQKCTYTGGTVFVANGKVRGDFGTTENDKTVNSHMIVDGTTSYIWTDGQKDGFKTTFDESKISATPSTVSTPEAGQSGSFDAQKPEDYKCEGWNIDSSLFELPKDVVFQDMNALIPTSVPATNGGAGNSSQCSYCDSLSGTEKTQCLSALNCK